MKKPAVIVTLVSVVLAGCAQTMFVKPGGSPESFEADKFDCEAKVQTMYGGQANMNFGHLATYRTDLFRCIRSKGWREATADEIASGQIRPSEPPASGWKEQPKQVPYQVTRDE